MTVRYPRLVIFWSMNSVRLYTVCCSMSCVMERALKLATVLPLKKLVTMSLDCWIWLGSL